MKRPNVASERLALLLRIREVSALNLGLKTDYGGFLWTSSVSPGKCRDSTINEATTTSFHINLSNSLFINHPIIRSCVRVVGADSIVNETTKKKNMKSLF
jgi:hypothetical protein